MVPIFFLIALDSLPPLPAPANLRLPEPAIQFDMDRDFLRAETYFGRYYGGGITCAWSGFFMEAAYAHDEKWLAGTDGRVMAAVVLPFKSLWFRPFFDGQWVKRTANHRQIGAGIDATSDLPWFVLVSGFRFDRWQIPGIDHEVVGYLSIYGDRFKIMPQAELNAIYRAGGWEPSVTARLHAGVFHFGLGSNVARDFPAPRLDLEYLTPRITAGIGIQKGKINNTLASYYDRDKPYRYPVPLPSEELKFGIDGKGRLAFGPVQLGGDAALFEWQNRLAPDNSLYLSLIHDLDELRVNFFIAATENISRVELRNALYLRYEKISKRIPDLPKYDLLDTLAINYGPAYVSLEVKYLHTREGTSRTLPRIILFNSRIGIRSKTFEIFCAVFNLGNGREEIFEGYYPGFRQVVGGIGLKL